MSVQSIGTSLSGSASAALQAPSLSLQDFLQVLLTQLQFQDPLKPMDNDQFLAQMAQFSTLALQQEQNSKTDSLLTIQSATQVMGLLGNSVQVSTSTGAEIGTVSAVSFQSDGTPQLTIQLAGGTVLNGVSLSQVTLVQAPVNSSSGTPTPTPTPTIPGP
jgi:flagellar basal-body rod modification protein FlgD